MAGVGMGAGATGAKGAPATKGGAPPKDVVLPEGYTASNPATMAAANAAKHYVMIPSQYGDKEKSKLTYTVVSGDQTHIIDLK